MSQDRQLEVRKRQMRWAISSPSLLSYPQTVDFCHSVTELLELQKRIESCQTLPELPAKLRMGKYFEQLVMDCIRLDPSKKLVLANHPVVEGKITIGEIDLIIQDLISDEFQHWEIALKYYLQTHEGEAHELMIGPNAVDSLDRKVKKLFARQLPLTKHPVFKETLDRLNIGQVEDRLFLKGMFFYHQGTCRKSPENSNARHERGWWIYQHEAFDFLDDQLRWKLSWKPNWIGPNQFSNSDGLATSQEMIGLIRKEFQASNRSLLLIGCKEENGILMEQTRGFVVNDNWPHLIREKG